MPGHAAQDPYDELDALIREAMGKPFEGLCTESSPATSQATPPRGPASQNGNVTYIFERLPDALLQGFSRKRD
jgi:hypothetical protein